MARRYLIKKRTTKYYVKRDRYGQFTEWTNKGRGLAEDRRKHAKTILSRSKVGYGHTGDYKK